MRLGKAKPETPTEEDAGPSRVPMLRDLNPRYGEIRDRWEALSAELAALQQERWDLLTENPSLRFSPGQLPSEPEMSPPPPLDKYQARGAARVADLVRQPAAPRLIPQTPQLSGQQLRIRQIVEECTALEEALRQLTPIMEMHRMIASKVACGMIRDRYAALAQRVFDGLCVVAEGLGDLDVLYDEIRVSGASPIFLQLMTDTRDFDIRRNSDLRLNMGRLLSKGIVAGIMPATVKRSGVEMPGHQDFMAAAAAGIYKNGEAG